MKLIQFELSGKFAHFNYPFTHKKKLKKTFNIIPKTTILGLLGSILGLKGYQNLKTNEPEFYTKLKDIKIYISLSGIFEKDLIKYNSINSFASNRVGIQIEEEILLNPKYEIGLIIDENNETHKNLLNIFSKNDKKLFSHYHLYLGKNEFFANINKIKIINDFEIEKFESGNEVKNINSIFEIRILEKDELKEILDKLILDTFSYDIDFSNNKKIISKICEIGYFLKEEFIFLKEETNFLKINNKYYYLF
jgi:CRISPR-associated protein Cas5h